MVHVGAYHKWRHALLVTDVIKDKNGNVLDITVASNTADRWNYPLSAYIYGFQAYSYSRTKLKIPPGLICRGGIF